MRPLGQRGDGATRLGRAPRPRGERRPAPPRQERAAPRAGAATAARPRGGWRAPGLGVGAIDERGLALPATLRASVETVDRLPGGDLLVGGYAFDPARPSRSLQLALFCGGRLVALDKPRRLRPDRAAEPGFEGVGSRRIGFRLRVPADACVADALGGTLVAALVDADGRMALLPVPPIAR